MDNYASDLARQIMLSLKKEFQSKHLSGNLLNNSYIIETEDYTEIHISAPSYDFYEYFINGVVIPPKNPNLPTEYASLLDTQGSEYTVYWETPAKTRSGKISSGKGIVHKAKKRPHNHIGYVNKILTEGISNWMNMQNLDIKVEQ